MPEPGASSIAEPTEPDAGPPVSPSSLPVSPPADDEPPVPRDVPLPALETSLEPAAIVEKLAFASRRGRLAGFHAGQEGGLFGVAAFGLYFDRILVADARSGAAGTRLTFRTKLPLTWPAICIAVLIFTIWPGVWLTDSLLVTYFPSYGEWWLKTWMWYLPLSVIPLPWAVRSIWRKSEAASHDSAHRAIRKIAAELDARVV
jgi:hypothetical protein